MIALFFPLVKSFFSLSLFPYRPPPRIFFDFSSKRPPRGSALRGGVLRAGFSTRAAGLRLAAVLPRGGVAPRRECGAWRICSRRECAARGGVPTRRGLRAHGKFFAHGRFVRRLFLSFTRRAGSLRGEGIKIFRVSPRGGFVPPRAVSHGLFVGARRAGRFYVAFFSIARSARSFSR